MKATHLPISVLKACCAGLSLASLTGCFFPLLYANFVEDTCRQGENMTDPQLVDGLEQDDAGFFVRIEWDTGTERGADLPDEYFAEIQNVGTVESPTFPEHEHVASAELSGEREITVRFSDSVDRTFLAQERELSFTLVFRDRRNFISCTHQGLGDDYFLDVVTAFDENGELVDAQFEQDFRVGPI